VTSNRNAFHLPIVDDQYRPRYSLAKREAAVCHKLTALAVYFGIAGCAAPMIWDKPGATRAEYDRDSYEYEKDARQSGYFGTGLIGALNMREFFKKVHERPRL
jgi:hypothetical protein